MRPNVCSKLETLSSDQSKHAIGPMHGVRIAFRKGNLL